MKNKFNIFITIGLIGMLYMGCELDPDFDPNTVPTINNLSISSPASLSCELPCSVTFSASSTLNSPANPSDQVTYTWDFGDGSNPRTGNNIVHEYTANANYDLTLTASASGAQDATIIVTFTVSNNLEITAINDLSIISPDPLSCGLPNCVPVFSATSNLVFPNIVGDQVTYTWDFGDGSAEEKGNNITHEYTEEGDYNITLKANASGALEVVLDTTFTVSPRNSFIVTENIPDRGYDVLEVSDGYIVFGWDRIVKFDKQGLAVRLVNVENFLGVAYTYGDFHVTGEDQFLLMSHNSDYATVDKDLNFSQVITSEQKYTINALVTRDEEIRYLGTTWNNNAFVDTIAFPNFDHDPDGLPQFMVETSFGNAAGFMSLFPKHKQIGDSYFMPVFEGLYGSLENSFWITEFPDNGLKVHSISDAENNNILVLGKDQLDDKLTLQKIDKVSGIKGDEINICDLDFPGGLLKVDDGIIIVTVVNGSDNCLTGGTIEGNTDIRILKLDFEYNTFWDRIINSPGDQNVREIREADDGGILITGTSSIVGINNLLFIKTNSEGIVQ